MKTQWHNPEKVPASKLPKGRRFLTKEESARLKVSNRISSVIWMWWDNYWDKSLWSGRNEDYTYCVPNNFSVPGCAPFKFPTPKPKKVSTPSLEPQKSLTPQPKQEWIKERMRVLAKALFVFPLHQDSKEWAEELFEHAKLLETIK